MWCWDEHWYPTLKEILLYCVERNIVTLHWKKLLRYFVSALSRYWSKVMYKSNEALFLLRYNILWCAVSDGDGDNVSNVCLCKVYRGWLVQLRRGQQNNSRNLFCFSSNWQNINQSLWAGKAVPLTELLTVQNFVDLRQGQKVNDKWWWMFVMTLQHHPRGICCWSSHTVTINGHFSNATMPLNA